MLAVGWMNLKKTDWFSVGSDEKKKRAEAETLGLVYLVQKEARLSAAEKQQYGSFLEKDFFTKNDFDDLDKFYGSAWDRLTDDGKAQMSHRVWEVLMLSKHMLQIRNGASKMLQAFCHLSIDAGQTCAGRLENHQRSVAGICSLLSRC